MTQTLTPLARVALALSLLAALAACGGAGDDEPTAAEATRRPLSATVDHAGDTVRISAQTTVDRTAFGVSGNMVGMMPSTTTLIADLFFAKA